MLEWGAYIQRALVAFYWSVLRREEDSMCLNGCLPASIDYVAATTQDRQKIWPPHNGCYYTGTATYVLVLGTF